MQGSLTGAATRNYSKAILDGVRSHDFYLWKRDVMGR